MPEIADNIKTELLGTFKIETEYDIVMVRQTIRQCAKEAVWALLTRPALQQL